MTFKRWDIVSVPFPFVEGYETKRRPALVVSTDDFHRAHNACFGAMITTARNMQDIRIDDIKIGDLVGAGLPQPCVIRLARLTTFDASNLIRRTGTLGSQDRRAVAGLLKRWLGI
ncbi:MAG: type II toxin-antitoxin system PemK/MazF family toxin [Proteobacteria bacterium]|nr:type II toxin-antitoxin system PemK/MazF family toxin [Pseudomonadota bacterium]